MLCVLVFWRLYAIGGLRIEVALRLYMIEVGRRFRRVWGAGFGAGVG